MKRPDNMPEFDLGKPVDFVIVGSGAAGGVLAKELSTSGFDVVVLEQGKWRSEEDFTHDELSVFFNQELVGGARAGYPQTFRSSETETARLAADQPAAGYARTVGGSSVHFSANYWRLRPVDFKERSLLGEMPGTGFADWPISYEELEPYYTKVDWEVGVSGAPGPFDPPRSKPYPVPPMPVKSAGVLLEKGARKIGLHPQVAPVAILSKSHNGRAPCLNCGFCMGFGCEAGAKSSSLAAMIPVAMASGRCELRSECTVYRLETNEQGRIDEVLYFDAEGKQRSQRAKAVILAANGSETPRLLLMSDSPRFPQGLANSSGLVGKYLMFNTHALVNATFEHPLNEYKGIQCTRIVHDFYDSDPKRGFYGGGALDGRPLFLSTPILASLLYPPADGPQWGSEFKQFLAESFTHGMAVACSTTSVPMASNNISLDPELKDKFGLPAMRVTYRDHDDDLAMAAFLQARGAEVMEAAGAKRVMLPPVHHADNGVHLLGTCRMGNDPGSSVIDRDHRSHDVPNLFMCDGSSFVSSGRGQPTMTIQALAFRAAERIGDLARRNEI
ncbi:MAG: GMC family oxidoreductase [Gammaproteobacteria bacterium]|jgi:choline dehydrogenase-like flavoprotein|nr:GMC family oxidoreductase [Gammaproteobacteria bacterium]